MNLTSGAWCYLNNDPANGALYGKLYNWYAVIDPRGLAPQNFHVANETDWNILSNYLGGNTISGGKMKETGTAHWLSPNTSANNESGFTALPGGLRDEYGGFGDYGGEVGFWWSKDTSNSLNLINRYLKCNDARMFIDGSTVKSGFSVRCLKN
jgi:uncharacterized protein (TIGR02145 family)